MSYETFLDGKASLCRGDSLHFLRDQPANRYDSIVTDPPYALVSISKRFGADNAAPVKVSKGGTGAYARASSGFMGKKWDTGETAFAVEFWQECLRVLKPGGHVVAFGGTRTYHRLAVAIEDAGFEIRDMLQWIYGSGFPKSHDVSKGIDRAAGATREVISQGEPVKRMIPGADQAKDGWDKTNGREFVPTVSKAATPEAAEWEGWGTALKPACEPICFGRKPLSEKTVAANVLRWGTGALNIGACRVNSGPVEKHVRTSTVTGANSMSGTSTGSTGSGEFVKGRWPANVLHDGSEEVVAGFPQTDPSSIGNPRDAAAGNGWGMTATGSEYDDAGSAARFFYTAKADSDDRLGSKHPTVKPVDLMQWLVRLVTPKGGLVLDPFAGTGTTAEACFREGMRCTMVERETEYQDDIRRRMALVMAGPDERSRESIKTRMRGKPEDHGPLFSQNKPEAAE